LRKLSFMEEFPRIPLPGVSGVCLAIGFVRPSLLTRRTGASGFHPAERGTKVTFGRSNPLGSLSIRACSAVLISGPKWRKVGRMNWESIIEQVLQGEIPWSSFCDEAERRLYGFFKELLQRSKKPKSISLIICDWCLVSARGTKEVPLCCGFFFSPQVKVYLPLYQRLINCAY